MAPRKTKTTGTGAAATNGTKNTNSTKKTTGTKNNTAQRVSTRGAVTKTTTTTKGITSARKAVAAAATKITKTTTAKATGKKGSTTTTTTTTTKVTKAAKTTAAKAKAPARAAAKGRGRPPKAPEKAPAESEPDEDDDDDDDESELTELEEDNGIAGAPEPKGTAAQASGRKRPNADPEDPEVGLKRLKMGRVKHKAVQPGRLAVGPDTDSDLSEYETDEDEPPLPPSPTTTATTTTTTRPRTTTTPTTPPTAANSRKRSRNAAADADVQPAPAKKPRTTQAAKPKPAKPAKAAKPKAIVNEAPKQRLNVYVFGANSGGELGLGRGGPADGVARPRLNPHLSADAVGVVAVATGGMHCAALTADNKILTWGVNDMGALGRDTTWEGGLVDMDATSDAGSDASDALNPREATPTAIKSSDFPEGALFVQLAASDNATFALTDDGKVFGWGTFRGNDGVIGFSPTSEIQRRPVAIPLPAPVTKITAGNNHVLALTTKGSVYAWGAGEQHQLGRRQMDRRGKMHSLTPALLLRKDVVGIGAGAFHSFAVRKDGQVLGWGLNSFGQAGVAAGGAGENNASVVAPSVVPALSRVPPRRGRTAAAQTTTAHLPAAASANDDGAAAAAATANAATASSPSAPSAPVAANATDPAASSAPASASASVAVAAGPTTDATANDVAPGAQQQQQQQQPRQQQQRYGLVTGITGGNNHSIALTDKGECLVWGRLDNFACGLQLGALPADDGEGGRLVVHDERGRPRILLAPTPVPGLGTVVHVAAGSDHSLAVAADGRAHAWGFNAEGQCGHGRELDEVETATPINNTAVRGKRLVWAGAGGQYSVLAGLAEQEQQEQQG